MSARGANEFDFNLQLAKQIHHHLTEMGFTRTTLLVSEGAQHRSLATRVARANQSGADVFLSIHHDSVPDRMLQKWEYDGTVAALQRSVPRATRSSSRSTTPTISRACCSRRSSARSSRRAA